MRFSLIHIVPETTNVPFIKGRFVAMLFSAALMIASIGAFATMGLNLGIDFVGGTLIEIETQEDANLSEIRENLNGLGFGEIQVQTFGAPNDVLIKMRQQEPENPDVEMAAERAQQQAANTVQETLVEMLPGVEFRRVEVVGPAVSGELVRAGILAVGLALGAMLIYIWFRFEWQFSLGAVIALTHDVIATMGMFAVTQFEFNLASIAAILTIVGYSMNDTVVVYDRIRENLRKFKRMPLAELLNLSINQTLSRTLMTSITTLMALFALFFLGGAVLRGFSFAMIWGVLIGTYSSIFVASPLLLLTGVKRGTSEQDS